MDTLKEFTLRKHKQDQPQEDCQLTCISRDFRGLFLSPACKHAVANMQLCRRRPSTQGNLVLSLKTKHRGQKSELQGYQQSGGTLPCHSMPLCLQDQGNLPTTVHLTQLITLNLFENHRKYDYIFFPLRKLTFT